MTAVDLHIHTVTADTRAADTAASPVLIAHGLFGSGRNWMTLARRFAAHRPVATVDMRNHGASPWSDQMDYPVMARDLLRAIDRVFGRPTLLLGHSMGGKAAMTAALIDDASTPRIAALAVVDIAPVDYAADPAGASGLDGENARYLRWMREMDLAQIARRADADAIMAEKGAPAGIRSFLLQNLVFGGERPSWRLNLAALDARLPDLVGWPTTLTDQASALPTLALRGGTSTYLDDAGAAALLGRFPNARIETVEGAGHWPHAEQPEAVAAILGDWFAAPAAPAPG